VAAADAGHSQSLTVLLLVIPSAGDVSQTCRLRY